MGCAMRGGRLSAALHGLWGGDPLRPRRGFHTLRDEQQPVVCLPRVAWRLSEACCLHCLGRLPHSWLLQLLTKSACTQCSGYHASRQANGC